MKRSVHAQVISLLAVAIGIPAGLAWACVAVFSLTTDSPNVQPGGTVMVTGKAFAEGSPVDIHLDSSTGPVLATAPAPAETMTSVFTIPVVIPANVSKGEHMLVATQEYHYMNSGSPARALLFVGTDAPPVAGAPARRAGLTVESGPGLSILILIALGVAVGGVLLTGGISAFATTRGGKTTGRPEPASTT